MMTGAPFRSPRVGSNFLKSSMAITACAICLNLYARMKPRQLLSSTNCYLYGPRGWCCFIRRINMIEGYYLSPQQRDLWLLQQRQPATAYAAQCAVRLEGSLRLDALGAAWQQLIRRHEILRTTYPRTPGIKLPVQCVAGNNSFDWSVVDLSAQPVVCQQELIDKLFVTQGRLGFDYEQGPLLQAQLVRRAPQRHILMVRMPALCADGRSLHYLVEELKRAYEAVKIDGEVKGELVQYAEYAEWQNQLLAETSEIAGRGRSYWQQQHQRAAGAVRRDGTVEKRGDKSQSNIRGQVRRKLSREIVKRLEEIGFRHGANLEEILLASWMTLIRRLEGNEDVVVGATVDGRKYGELEGALGLYSRNVPIY